MYKNISNLKPINFDNEEMKIKLGKYPDDQNFIELYEPISYDLTIGIRYLIATVRINIPGNPNYNLDDRDVVIKNYSENAGILEALIANNIIEEPHAELPCKFVTLYVAKLK